MRESNPGERHPDALRAVKVTRKILHECGSQFLIVSFWFQRGLLFPLFRLKVGVPFFQAAIAKNPSRGSGENRNAFEEGAILKNASTGHQLSQAARVDASKLWDDRQDRFGLCGKVKSVVRFMEVDSAHTVSIVEKHRRAARAIDKQPLESTVEPSWKCSVLFHMRGRDRKALIVRIRVRLHFQPSFPTGIRVLLSGKRQDHVSALVCQRHTVGK